ncbi:MAG: SUMF1/EgtB/PvdO family nonheme iron enzyme, partial [Odoribacter sp.]|nr:SUMF1/EgtB/PvdO family nonheme iron enzyme [Odoribacter sp.]
DGKARVTGFVGDTAIIELNLGWDNSWRDDFNWDAAWIFFKFKKRELENPWHHAYLSREGHHATPRNDNEGGSYMFMFGETGQGNSAQVTGLFVMRETISEGKANICLQIKWPLTGTGLQKSDFGDHFDKVYIAVHAIEMVYIPYGNYALGDNRSHLCFHVGDSAVIIVDSEESLQLAQNKTITTLPASYPKGYAGFYIMKYEISQEQYVEFLNSLTLEQQKAHVSNNNFEQMKRGDYVFGDVSVPNNRNGIVFIEQKGIKTPAVFGNNLNPANDLFSPDDGQTLACNYLSPFDMLAYCDWSGLRPMSELEYEKSCRPPYPHKPQEGEYAWNTNSHINPLNSLADLVYQGEERENANSNTKNVNSGGRLNGPVRCGLFATTSSNQIQSGATYWGVMDMSGNLWEMCYNATTEGAKFAADNFEYSHGNGKLDLNGAAGIPATYWPVTVGAIGIRGGSFNSADSLLRTSDRTFASGNYFTDLTQRDSSVGFRGARSILNTTGFSAGEIRGENGLDSDTVCALTPLYQIGGDPAMNTIGKVTYSWYISEDNGTTWQIIENASDERLNYTAFSNQTNTFKSCLIKRKAVCAVGEETTQPIRITMRLPVTKPLITSEVWAGLNYRFKFPCPGSDSIVSIWHFPDGTEQMGPEVYINSYRQQHDGVYYISYRDALGCDSDQVPVNIKGIPEGIPVVDYGDYRGWADGSYSKSALDYLHPKSPYVYLGHTGSGYYKLQPEHEAFNVYCDMITDDGGWMMILDKDIERYSWEELKEKWGFEKTADCYYYEGISSEGYYWGYWSNYYNNYQYNSSGSCDWGWNCDDTYAFDFHLRKLPHTTLKISEKVSVNSNALGSGRLYNQDHQVIWYVTDGNVSYNYWETSCGRLYNNQICTDIVYESRDRFRIQHHYFSSGYNGNPSYLRSIYIR